MWNNGLIFSNKTKKIILAISLIVFSVFLLYPVYAHGEESGIKAAQEGLNNTAKKGFGNNVTENADISTTIGKIIGYALAFIGVLFFGLIIYGGIIWMLARGNEQETTKAKNIIEAAVIGLIIVLAAYAITAYIGGALT